MKPEQLLVGRKMSKDKNKEKKIKDILEFNMCHT